MDAERAIPMLPSNGTPSRNVHQGGPSMSYVNKSSRGSLPRTIPESVPLEARDYHYSQAESTRPPAETYHHLVPSYHSQTVRGPEHNSSARLDRIADKLWFEMMKQPAFRKYREKMPKAGERDDQKWPEQMEIAFVRALVEHPPIGRRKLNNVYTNDSKSLRGRNELIAIYIEKQTGIKRDRKQVSSHIQVLKPMFRDQPWILSYFKSDREVASRYPRSRNRARPSLARAEGDVEAVRGLRAHDTQLPSPAPDVDGRPFRPYNFGPTSNASGLDQAHTQYLEARQGFTVPRYRGFDMENMLTSHAGSVDARQSPASLSDSMFSPSPFSFGGRDVQMALDSPVSASTCMDFDHSIEPYGSFEPVTDMVSWIAGEPSMFDQRAYGILPLEHLSGHSIGNELGPFAMHEMSISPMQRVLSERDVGGG